MTESEIFRPMSEVERVAYAEQQQALSVAAMAYQLHAQALARLDRVLTSGDPSLAIDPARGVIVRVGPPAAGDDATA